MSTNDGQKLLVFGLGFAQQDNRRMQQVLRHYKRLPSNPGNRTSLFLELNNLAKELMTDEAAQGQIQQLTEWMKNGGNFPLSVAPDPLSADAVATHQHSDLGERQRYYDWGRGHTLSDAPEEGDQEDDLSEPLGNNESKNDVYSADNRAWDTITRRYGRGRTINDHPEAVNFGGSDGSAIHGNFDNNIQQDTTGERTFHMYGEGRTRNNPPEPVTMNEDNNGVEGAFGQHPVVEEVATTNPINTTGSGNENAGLLEGGFGNDEIQLQPTTSEPSDTVVVPHHNSPMHPDEADNTEAIECPICLEEYPPSGFPKRPTITELCDHPDKACLQCLKSSITVMIEQGALHLLVCPICPQRFSHKDIKEYSSEEVYKRYEYLKQQSEIPGHFISCMNTHCGGSQPHESEGPKMICNHCSFATCAKHKRPWHEGQTCEEFDLDDAQIERLEEEEATAKLLAKESTSICPKCGQGVTKVDGCDHMQCQCGEEWCYVCSCSWENVLRIGKLAHATFCIYHPNKVNLTKAQQEATRRRILGLVHGGEVSAELAKARDDLRQRRRVEIRAKALKAAEARMEEAREKKRSISPPPENNKKKVKLVAPWEEGGWTKKPL